MGKPYSARLGPPVGEEAIGSIRGGPMTGKRRPWSLSAAGWRRLAALALVTLIAKFVIERRLEAEQHEREIARSTGRPEWEGASS